MGKYDSIYEKLNENPQGFNGLVGVKLESAEPGQVVCSLEVTDEHINPMGTLHGGVLFTLLDVTAGLSAMCKEDKIRSVVTQCADVHFLRAVRSKKLIAKGMVIKDGKNTAVIRADVLTEDGLVLATGTFDMFYTDKGNTIPNT